LEEVNLHSEKEMTIRVKVRKSFRSHLKKEKGVLTVLSEKEHLTRFNPGPVALQVLEKDLFKKERKDLEVKDPSKKEKPDRSIQDQTDHHVSPRNHLQSGKRVAMINLSEKENPAHLIHDQTDLHASPRSHLQSGKRVVMINLSEKEKPVHLIHDPTDLHTSPRSHLQNGKRAMKNLFKKENPVHLIQGKKDHHDLKRNHSKKEIQKAEKKNHLNQAKGKTNLFAKAAILDYPTRESRLTGNVV
jgi:hypothetical protein